MSKTLIYRDYTKPISIQQIGGKAYNLRHLSKHNFPVPKWFCLTTEFFREFMGEKITDYEKLLQNYIAVNRQKIINLIQGQEFSSRLQKLVNEQLAGFSKLAVRSSATDEDGNKYSFAGMMDSFLNVASADVFAYIKKCYISTFSSRAMAYRAQHDLISPQLAPAVIIMEMIPADVAGVIFTTNPRTNNPDEILISAVKGLGEKLVSGEQDSQDYIINLSNEISSQSKQTLLSPTMLIKLAKLARAVESSYSVRCAQDLEYSIQGDHIYLLQARPITAYAHLDKNLPRTILDNSNIIESYSGVTTPLTFSFAAEVYGKIYHQTLHNFGIKQSAIDQIDDALNHMLYFYQNKIYYNLGNWYKMTALYPGYNKNKKYMENMMGVKVPLHEPALQRHTKTVKIYARFLRKMLSMKRDSKKFLKKFQQVTAPLRGQDFAGKSNAELLQIYEQLEREILDDFTTPIANDMGAMVFYGLLTDKVRRSKLPNGDGLISQILSQQGGVESLKPTTELLKIVHTIKQDDQLYQLFQTASTTELTHQLKQNALPIFQQLNHYLAQYGARSMEELKLETVTMTQDPSFLFQTIKQYLDNNIASAPQPSSDHAAATQQLLHQYHFINKFYTKKLLDITKYFVRNRELLRLQRTYIYDIARAIFTRLGYNFAAGGIIKNYRDIFFLEKPEIFQLAKAPIAKINPRHWQKLISARQAEYKQNQTQPTYERMYFYGTVTTENMLPIFSAQEMQPNDHIFYGVAGGGEPKIGIVQYITDPSQALRSGAILMARRTDPGWAVLFPLARAIIIERGSILSHSAVVAREMGKTLVVGVRGLTDKIHDGDKVKVDGINGTVEVLDE